MTEGGLILEGGAERGTFTAGALDYLMEQGLLFSYVCGVSAGACNAVDYAAGQIGRSKRAFIPETPDMRMAKLSSIFTQRSLIDMDMLFDDFPNRRVPFDYDAYFASPQEVEMVVTNALTGAAEYLDDRTDRNRMMDICRASSSIPVFTPMVEVDGTPYVDGGIADSIPIVRSLRKGNRKNFVILTREAGYRKGAVSGAEKAFYKAVFRRYPALLAAILRRPMVYNRQLELLEKWEKEGRVFVLRPEMKAVGRLESDPEKLTPFFDHGYALMKERMEALLAYLAA